MTSIHRNLQDALVAELRHLETYGTVRPSRNGDMRELVGRCFTLQKPYERFQTLLHRNANPIAQLAETLWVLAGRNDIAWLSYYLPRATDFSDDGTAWRAGYGPRLRHWPIRIDRKGSVDQVANVLNLLRADPDSRRAVLSLWDPVHDYVKSKDIPCNNWIQFLVRDGELQMHIAVRSNDVMWGWSGINTFEWSFLQELMANELGVRVGAATYFIGSFHLYQQHYARAERILDARQRTRTYQPYVGATEPNLGMTLFQLDAWLANDFFDLESAIRTYPAALEANLRATDLHGAQNDMLRMLDVYARVQARDIPPAEIRSRALLISREDMCLATLEWLNRQPYYSPATAEPETLVDRQLFDAVTRLQAAKARLYGDSWKRYGQRGSIFPNIARKYDRLENIVGNGALPPPTETLLDTIVDLGVYATLYLSWLRHTTFKAALDEVELATAAWNGADTWKTLQTAFGHIVVCLGMDEHAVEFTVPVEYQRLDDAAVALATAAFVWAGTFRHADVWDKFLADVSACEEVKP